MTKRNHKIERACKWSCHTPNLLNEALTNKGMYALEKPFQIFARILGEVAERAIKLDDPELNILMLRLTLYDIADMDKHDSKKRDDAMESQYKRLEGN